MKFDTSTVGEQVSILLQQLDLPTAEPNREELLNDLELAVEAVLAEHGLAADRVKTIGGHTYASIDADCPECRERLRVIEPFLDASNGAFATASCDCGWRGEAVYRLIDLREPQSEHADDASSEDSEATEAGFEDVSNVRQTNIQPQYYPY